VYLVTDGQDGNALQFENLKTMGRFLTKHDQNPCDTAPSGSLFGINQDIYKGRVLSPAHAGR